MEKKLAFMSACNKVKNIRVVNGSIERGVKLSFDFLSTAKNRDTKMFYKL